MTTELPTTPSTTSSSAPACAAQVACRLDLAVVLPTYNERDNIAEVICRIEVALKGLSWELIFVDDDSPDGTAELVQTYAERDPRIRLVHRIGRRGLSSACVEGIMATSAMRVAVMDADLQHDEKIMPTMLKRMSDESLDIVVGTRNAEGGSMGSFSEKRVLLSRMGSWISKSICRCDVSDPMSGFFLVDRSFFLKVARELQPGGFKILVDMFASSKGPVRFGEVGYRFRNREHGKSKLDANTAIEYLFLIVSKTTGGFIPTQFVMFSLVGATGLVAHLICLAVLFSVLHVSFWVGQSIATVVAMTENFFLNNLITYRDRSLHGLRLISGLLSFWVACSFGAWANVIFARSLLHSGATWYVAGLAGVVVSSVWNYSISSLFTWQMPRESRRAMTEACLEYGTGREALG